MARIINQNNEVIATKNNNNGGKKATVSKTSFIVGLALAIALIAIIVVVILFVTTKEKAEDKKTKTPLLQYIENYTNETKINPKIKLLEGATVIPYEMERVTGECYILIYDVDWMTENESDSELYKSYDRLDSYLTGKNTIDGKTVTGDPLLKAIENCGQDIKFYVVDYKSMGKTEKDLEKNPEYFKLHGEISFYSLKSPMLFHYIETESYTDMNDKDLIIADGNTKSGQWKAIINKEVNYLNSLTNNTDN